MVWREFKHWHGVSIHAPVKGATNGFAKIGFSNSVSIHAPVKGATAIF